MNKNKIILILLDIISLYIAIVAAVLLRGFIHTRAVQTIGEWEAAHFLIFLPSLFASLLFLYIAGLYDAKTLQDRSKSFVLLIYTQVSSALFAILFYYVARTELTPKLTLFLYILISITLISLFRSLFLYLTAHKTRETAVLLTDNPSLQQRLEAEHAPYILKEISWNNFVEAKPKVVIFSEKELDLDKISMLESLKSKGVLVYSYNQYYELVHKKIDLDYVDWDEFLRNISLKKESAGHYVFRRLIDITSGITLLVPFIISLPFVYIVNKFFNKGKLFFPQDRVGYLGKRIWIYKLRTMESMDSGALFTEKSDGKKVHGLGNRVTPFGLILRKTRLDELPQCINLLRGDVSMIGPRADIIGFHNELSSSIKNFKTKLLVAQGLTGWAQVHMSIQPKTLEEHVERFAYEAYYIKYYSVFLDITIILKTVKTILSREGA